MKISKEVKVGFVSLFAIALVIWGYNYLKGTNLFVSSKIVYAVYPKVPGLSVSAPIIVNGVQCGVVDDIYFHPDKSSRVLVKLNIAESGISIPNNSVANLISLDLLSAKAIGLSLGDSPNEIQNGDTIQSHFEKSMLDDVTEQLLPVKEKAENLMLSMDSAVVEFNKVMENLNDVLGERNKRNLSVALTNLKNTVESFDMVAKNLNATINNSVKPTMRTYKNLGDSLAALDMRNTLTKAQSALDNMSLVLDKMNKGDGTMGKLMNNDSLYNNLTGATKEMEELLRDIKLHPKRYFRVLSKKEIPYQKEEDK